MRFFDKKSVGSEREPSIKCQEILVNIYDENNDEVQLDVHITLLLYVDVSGGHHPLSKTRRYSIAG